MKKLIGFLIFLFALPAFAQTSTPPSPSTNPLNFSMATYASMWKGPAGIEAANLEEGTLQISPHWAAKSWNLIIPNPGMTIDTLGGEGCGTPKNSLWLFCGGAGVGAVTSPAPVHLAEDGHLRINYDAGGNKTFSFNVINLQYVHGAVVDGALANGQPRSASNSLSVSVGLNICVKFLGCTTGQ